MKTDCTSAFRQDGVTSRFTLHVRDDPRIDEAHEGRRPVRCGDHERSRSPEALVRLRRCPWRRAASHAAGPGRGHGAERLARSGAHATKGWEGERHPEKGPRQAEPGARVTKPATGMGTHGPGEDQLQGPEVTAPHGLTGLGVAPAPTGQAGNRPGSRGAGHGAPRSYLGGGE